MTAIAAETLREALVSFGVNGAPVLLDGGKGGTWRAGQVVLKPVEFLPETLWRSELLSGLPESPEFRVARPVRALDGGWVAHGWEVSELVAGQPDVRRPSDALRAGIAFHEAIADVPRPAYLDLRNDPWAIGDRVAWDEQRVDLSSLAEELVAPLMAARRPVELTPQVVHGDLLGNVLFAPGLPPAVIDWPPYWRPASWASAVVVVDAVSWYGAGPALAAKWSRLPAWGQMLVRALIYRIVTTDLAAGSAGFTAAREAEYRAAVAHLAPFLH